MPMTRGLTRGWSGPRCLRLPTSPPLRRRRYAAHAPSKVIPFVVSAGGGVTEATDKMFPAPKGRNGRHYQRQHLSGVLVTFRQQLAAEFASRNCAYTAAGPATA